MYLVALYNYIKINKYILSKYLKSKKHIYIYIYIAIYIATTSLKVDIASYKSQ